MVKKETLSSREEWLNARKTTIGGSDAAIILGLNPYKTNRELFDEKMGMADDVDLSDNPYIRFGVAAEPYMREMFALDYPEYEVFYEEDNIWHNTDYPFAHASLDGWLREKSSGRNGIFENKTVNIQNSTMLSKWNDAIPDNYYCQLLHYLLVTDFDFAILKARLRWEKHDDKEVYCQIRHYKIDRADVLDDIEMLKAAEIEFFDHLKSGKTPHLKLPSI